MKLAEQCHCGAAFELQGKWSPYVALHAVELWREEHSCPVVSHGGEATLEVVPDDDERMGFRAERKNET